MLFLLAVAAYIAVGTTAQSTYYLGAVGQSCTQTCYAQGMNCNAAIQTENSPAIFQQLGVVCSADPAPWWGPDQPSYSPPASGGGSGTCYGYVNVPAAVPCSGAFPTTQRVCRCDTPSAAALAFGTSLSSAAITTTEQFIFNHHIAAGATQTGVMTHFWTTYPTAVDDGVVVRYYVDGESEASIVMEPSLAAGVGFYDPTAPWGTKWFGKGANNGGWFWNFRIPFQKSILVSVQHTRGTFGGFYMIVRGAMNVGISVGEISIPLSTARLVQTTTNTLAQPLDWVVLADVARGQRGVMWMHTLSVASGNENFLEGCFHAYFPGTTPALADFPGLVLSSGSEDYYDSAWYFDAGPFHNPVAGYTHINWTHTEPYAVTWSAYRFHEVDPLQFTDGFQFVWRVGDTMDPAGLKCFSQNGTVVGSPTASQVKGYAWVYTY